MSYRRLNFTPSKNKSFMVFAVPSVLSHTTERQKSANIECFEANIKCKCGL